MRRPHGFTLLELLVAIALMAIVAGSLYGSLYAANKSHRSATSAVEPARGASLTLELLRQDFDAALPPNGILAGGFSGTDGAGSGYSDSLLFYSCANNAQDVRGGSEIRKVELSVENSDSGDPLLIRRITNNLLPAAEPVVYEQVLCRHVKNFNLRYYDGTQWLDSWESTAQSNVLPIAVEVTLEYLPGEERSDDSRGIYRMTRIFRLACAHTAQDVLEEEF